MWIARPIHLKPLDAWFRSETVASLLTKFPQRTKLASLQGLDIWREGGDRPRWWRDLPSKHNGGSLLFSSISFYISNGAVDSLVCFFSMFDKEHLVSYPPPPKNSSLRFPYMYFSLYSTSSRSENQTITREKNCYLKRKVRTQDCKLKYLKNRENEQSKNK